MKIERITSLLFVGITLLVVSCDDNPCDAGFREIETEGGSFCIPDHHFGIENEPNVGNLFYHDEFGVIEYTNGKWTNEYGEDLTESMAAEHID